MSMSHTLTNTAAIKRELKQLQEMMKATTMDKDVEMTAIDTIQHMNNVLQEMASYMESDDASRCPK